MNCHPISRGLRVLVALGALLAGLGLRAATYTITQASGFSSLPSTLQAGDVVLVKNGTYLNVARTLNAAGTVANPVHFRAENPGQVFFGGATQFQVRGTALVISGFVFDGDVVAGGPASASGVFRFNVNSSDCVLRDCVFNNFDTGVGIDGAFWVLINGYRHTVEYCRFAKKQQADPIINIVPQEDDSAPAGTYPTRDIPRRHLIRYCYFGERTNISDNGYETIRTGGSEYQMYDLSTVVEYCVFEKAIYGADVTGYEPEVISNKSRNNIYRYNTFIHCKGGIVLRHGDDCVVEGNFFFGEPGSVMGSGIRVIGLRHLVRNNYLQDIDGTGFRAAICVTKGSGEWDVNSGNNAYESAGYARIFHNTIVNSAQPLNLGATSASSGTTAPVGVEVRGNVVQSAAGDGAILTFNDANGWSISSVAFSANWFYHPSGTYGAIQPATGVTTGAPVQLAADAGLGYHVPQPGSPVLGQAPATIPATVRDLRGKFRGATRDAGSYDSQATGAVLNRPLTRADVGPSYDGRNSTAMAPLILVSPASQTAPEFGPASFSVTVGGEGPFTYQWFKDDAPLAGATGATLTFASVLEADEGAYTVAIVNAAGTALSVPASLVVTPSRPVITASPAAQTVAAGATFALHVSASGELPLTYTWKRDGIAIPGATAATLTIANAQPGDAGTYTVVVANSYGEVESTGALVEVLGASQALLLNDTFSGNGFKTQQLPVSALWRSSSTTSSGNLALQSGALLVPAGRHALAYFTDGPPQSLAVGDELVVAFTVNFTSVGTGSGGFRVGLFNSNGVARPADGNNDGFTQYDGFLVATTPQIPDGTSSALTLMQRRTDVAGTLLSSTQNVYTALATIGGNTQSFVTGTNYLVRLVVARTAQARLSFSFTVTGGALTAYGFEREIDASTVHAFDAFAVLSVSANANGSSYLIDNVSVTHTAAPAAVAPTILAQPQSASVNPGESVTFSADATGTPVPTFQWRKGGVAIEGATGASYTIASAAAGDAGDYDVVATNSAGSATSNVAVLTVASPLSALQTWRVTYFGAPEATGDAADLADPDADGLVNLVEYALGFDPKEADVAALPATASADGQWVFNYTRPVGRSDLTYTVQVSTNLQTWATVAQEQAAVVGDTATWRAVYPQAGNPNAFFRLSVSPAVP
jgi:hypothetical protein